MYVLLLTAIRLVSPGARIGKLHAVFVHTPADTHRTMALRRLVEALRIAVRRIGAQEFICEPPSDRSARPIRLLEAATPFPRSHLVRLVLRAGVYEWLDATLVLVVLQVVQLLGREESVVVQVQMAEHPL